MSFDNRAFKRCPAPGVVPGSMLAGMMPLSMRSVRGDTNGNITNEQLIGILDRVYERATPDHPLLNVLSFNTSIDSGNVASRYYEGSSRARFSAMGPQSADFNTADLKKQAITIPIEHYFSGYEVWMREAEALALADDQAVPRMSRSITQAYRDLLILHSLVGDPDAGISGLLNSDKITNNRRYSDTARLDANSTAAAITNTLVDLAHSIADTSEDIYGDEGGYICAVPSQLFRKAASTYFGQDSNISAKDRFELTTGFQLVPINRLNSLDNALLQNGTSGTSSAVLAGKFTSDTHEKILPKPLEFLQPHTDSAGLRVVVPATTAIGGLHLYEPLSFAVGTNIWDTV